ncbi:MAG: hypothetical protein IIZ78_13245 [Clostridiales bacterium]|nr:hypothetical protein [Clostridiales bacterium]
MIEVNKERVRVEGDAKTILNDWMNATKAMYYMIARDLGLKETSEVFIEALQVAANDAANDLRKKGELPNE